MIAGDPNPFAISRQPTQFLHVVFMQSVRRFVVMEAVAEADDAVRISRAYDLAESFEGRAGVVGRQVDAAGRIAGAFGQMKIGDDEGRLFRPEQRAAELSLQRDAVDPEGGSRLVLLR